MNKTGLTGQAIEHSLMPALYNAAYKKLGLDWQYELYPCETEGDFEAVVKTAKREGSGFIGLNVAAPYKGHANRLASGRNQDVSLIQAADTLTFNAGRSRAYAGVYADNTDGRGIIAALRQADVELKEQKVVICGSDSVAWSALLELVKAEVESVTVLSGNPQETRTRALALLRGVGKQRYERMGTSIPSGNRGEMVRWNSDVESIVRRLIPKTEVVALPFEQTTEALNDAAVLINTTPLGAEDGNLSPGFESLMHPSLVVLDTVSGHDQTKLVTAAHAADAVVIDGLSVLMEQTALSIELWLNAQGFRMEAPREAVHTVDAV